MRFARAVVREYTSAATVTLFLALQGADATLAASWAVLTFGSLFAALSGSVDIQRPLSYLEQRIGYLLAAFALSAAFGVDPRRSFALSVPVLSALLIWVLIARGHGTRGIASAAIGFACCALVQCGLLISAAIAYTTGAPENWVNNAGATWLVVPNDIAWMACVLPLLAVVAENRARVVLPALLVAFLILCVLLRSRTAAVVAIIVALTYFALSSRAKWASKNGLLLGTLSVLIALAAFGAASMHARMQLWIAALSIFRDHPWIGVGLHDYVIVYRQYLPAYAQTIDPRLTPWPHNLFLEITAECGLIGIIAVAILIAGLLRQCRREWGVGLSRARCALYAGLAGMGLLAAVEASLLRQWVWIVGAVLCALAAKRSHGNEKNEKQRLVESAAPGRIHDAARG